MIRIRAADDHPNLSAIGTTFEKACVFLQYTLSSIHRTGKGKHQNVLVNFVTTKKHHAAFSTHPESKAADAGLWAVRFGQCGVPGAVRPSAAYRKRAPRARIYIYIYMGAVAKP